MTRPLAWTYRPNRVPRSSNVFESVISSLGVGAPPSATSGTSLTPAQNAYGASWATLIPGLDPGGGLPYVSKKAYGIWICIHAGGVSTNARDILVKIGVDTAGATSYVDKILHLAAPSASPYLGASLAGGVWYYFPITIDAGTSIGAKASVNNASVGTVRCFCILECDPTRPDLLRTGTTVTTYGADTATSAGTAVVPGTVSDGSWVQLGSALTERTFFWQIGIGCNSGTMENATLHGDLALETAGVKRQIIFNRVVHTTSGELLSARAGGTHGEGLVGDLVYARLQQNGTLNVYSCIAYGVS